MFWLLVWQGVSQVLGQEILLVSPVSVLRRLLELAVTADFWSSIAFSIIRIMGGFLLAAFLGILLGALAAGIGPFIFGVSGPRMVLGVVAMCIVIFRHKENIVRLVKGTEPDFKAAKPKKKAETQTQGD